MLFHINVALCLYASVASAAPLDLSEAFQPQAGIVRVNQCNHSAWFTVVDAMDYDIGGVIELRQNETYFTPYHVSMGGGVSEKYSNSSFEYLTDDDSVVQLEYKLGPDSGPERMFYDLSFINCGAQSQTSADPCVFQDGGYLIDFDFEDPNHCPHIYCPQQGDPTDLCSSAYYHHDDIETFTCVDVAEFWNRVNMTVTFCPSEDQLQKFTQRVSGGRTSHGRTGNSGGRIVPVPPVWPSRPDKPVQVNDGDELKLGNDAVTSPPLYDGNKNYSERPTWWVFGPPNGDKDHTVTQTVQPPHHDVESTHETTSAGHDGHESHESPSKISSGDTGGGNVTVASKETHLPFLRPQGSLNRSQAPKHEPLARIHHNIHVLG